MASLVRKLDAHKPGWLDTNIHYEVITGSQSYGCAGPDSDVDVAGFAIPPKAVIFPHLAGEIPGFGTQLPRFEQWQHKSPDYTIYGIVKFFDLCMGCNPNMIDTLFVPDRCVIHCTSIGQMVRDARHLFLCKKAWHTFKGYAYSQQKRIKDEANLPQTSKRRALIEQFGYDVKFAYHIVRLMNECRQILEEQNIDLERDREQYKAVRRGEWTLDYLNNWFQEQMLSLEPLYNSSPLRHTPDESAIKALLMQCLEEHYGSLSDAVARVGRETEILRDLQIVLDKYR